VINKYGIVDSHCFMHTHIDIIVLATFQDLYTGCVQGIPLLLLIVESEVLELLHKTGLTLVRYNEFISINRIHDKRMGFDHSSELLLL